MISNFNLNKIFNQIIIKTRINKIVLQFNLDNNFNNKLIASVK